MHRMPSSQYLHRVIWAALLAASAVVVSIAPVWAAHGTQTLTQVAGPPVEVVWDAAYSGTAADKLRAQARSPDGSRLFLTGTDGTDMLTIAVNAATGAELWRKTFNGPASGMDEGRAIAVSADGNTVYVTGSAERVYIATPVFTFGTVAYRASDGVQLWSSAPSSLFTSSSRDVPMSICFSADPDGAGEQAAMVFVTGSSINRPFPGTAWYATGAYNAASGAVMWTKRFATNTTATFDPTVDIVVTSASAIACDADRVYVTGLDLDTAGTDFDATTRALARTTGAQAWVHRHDGPLGENDLGFGIALSADGATVIVIADVDETFDDTQPPRTLTESLDPSTGAENWANVLTELDFSFPFAVVVGSSDPNEIGTGAPGRIYVTGEGPIPGGGEGSFVIAYEPGGSTAWGPVLFDGGPDASANFRYVARSIATSPAPTPFSGEWVYITGTETVGGPQTDLTTVGYVGFIPDGAPDPVDEGDLLWDARFDGPASGNDGELFVFDGADVVTWVDVEKDLPGNQLVTVAPDGATVYAAGTTVDASTSYNVSAYGYTGATPPTVTILDPTGTEPVTLTDTEVGGLLGTTVEASLTLGDFPLAGDTLDLLLDGSGNGMDNLAFQTGTGTYLVFQRFLRDNTQPFECSNEGLHTLAVRAEDTVGLFGTDSLEVDIDNTSFPDVACENFAFLFIEALVRNGIAAGFGDGTYRPNTNVNRGQMAVFMARSADRILGDFDAFSPPPCGSETFSDVDCNFFAYKFVEYIVSKGIASGFPDGTYRPNNAVSRNAMAVFLSRVRNLADGDFDTFSPPPCGSETFPDVDCTHPSYKFIEYIVSKGITAGFPDGEYKPGRVVTRAQMAVFITRAVNLVF